MPRKKPKDEPIYLTARNGSGTYVLHEAGLSITITIDIVSLTLQSRFPIALPALHVLALSKEQIAKLPVDRELDDLLVKVFIKRIRSKIRQSLGSLTDMLPSSERKAKRKEIKMLIESLSEKQVDIQGSASAHYHRLIVDECSRMHVLSEELKKTDRYFAKAIPWAKLLLTLAGPDINLRVDEFDENEKEITAGGPYNIVREDRPDAISISSQNKIRLNLNEERFSSSISCGYFSREESLMDAAWLSAFGFFHLTRRTAFTLHVVIGNSYDGALNSHRWSIHRGAVCCFYQSTPENEFDYRYDD